MVRISSNGLRELYQKAKKIQIPGVCPGNIDGSSSSLYSYLAWNEIVESLRKGINHC